MAIYGISQEERLKRSYQKAIFEFNQSIQKQQQIVDEYVASVKKKATFLGSVSLPNTIFYSLLKGVLGSVPDAVTTGVSIFANLLNDMQQVDKSTTPAEKARKLAYMFANIGITAAEGLGSFATSTAANISMAFGLDPKWAFDEKEGVVPFIANSANFVRSGILTGDFSNMSNENFIRNMNQKAPIHKESKETVDEQISIETETFIKGLTNVNQWVNSNVVHPTANYLSTSWLPVILEGKTSFEVAEEDFGGELWFEGMKGVAESIGTILVAQSLGKTLGKGMNLSTSQVGLISNSYFASSIFGKSFSEAIRNGASMQDAYTFAAGSSLTEMIIENIGGITPSGTDEVLKQTGKASSKISGVITKADDIFKKIVGSKWSEILKNSFSEGLEEVIAEYGSSGLSFYGNKDNKMDLKNPEDFYSSVFFAFLTGAISGGVMSSVSSLTLDSTVIGKINRLSDSFNAKVKDGKEQQAISNLKKDLEAVITTLNDPKARGLVKNEKGFEFIDVMSPEEKQNFYVELISENPVFGEIIKYKDGVYSLGENVDKVINPRMFDNKVYNKETDSFNNIDSSEYAINKAVKQKDVSKKGKIDLVKRSELTEAGKRVMEMADKSRVPVVLYADKSSDSGFYSQENDIVYLNEMSLQNKTDAEIANVIISHEVVHLLQKTQGKQYAELERKIKMMVDISYDSETGKPSFEYATEAIEQFFKKEFKENSLSTNLESKLLDAFENYSKEYNPETVKSLMNKELIAYFIENALSNVDFLSKISNSTSNIFKDIKQMIIDNKNITERFQDNESFGKQVKKILSQYKKSLKESLPQERTMFFYSQNLLDNAYHYSKVFKQAILDKHPLSELEKALFTKGLDGKFKFVVEGIEYNVEDALILDIFQDQKRVEKRLEIDKTMAAYFQSVFKVEKFPLFRKLIREFIGLNDSEFTEKDLGSVDLPKYKKMKEDAEKAFERYESKKKSKEEEVKKLIGDSEDENGGSIKFFTSRIKQYDKKLKEVKFESHQAYKQISDIENQIEYYERGFTYFRNNVGKKTITADTEFLVKHNFRNGYRIDGVDSLEETLNVFKKEKSVKMEKTSTEKPNVEKLFFKPESNSEIISRLKEELKPLYEKVQSNVDVINEITASLDILRKEVEEIRAQVWVLRDEIKQLWENYLGLKNEADTFLSEVAFTSKVEMLYNQYQYTQEDSEKYKKEMDELVYRLSLADYIFEDFFAFEKTKNQFQKDIDLVNAYVKDDKQRSEMIQEIEVKRATYISFLEKYPRYVFRPSKAIRFTPQDAIEQRNLEIELVKTRKEIKVARNETTSELLKQKANKIYHRINELKRLNPDSQLYSMKAKMDFLAQLYFEHEHLSQDKKFEKKVTETEKKIYEKHIRRIKIMFSDNQDNFDIGVFANTSIDWKQKLSPTNSEFAPGLYGVYEFASEDFEVESKAVYDIVLLQIKNKIERSKEKSGRSKGSEFFKDFFENYDIEYDYDETERIMTLVVSPKPDLIDNELEIAKQEAELRREKQNEEFNKIAMDERRRLSKYYTNQELANLSFKSTADFFKKVGINIQDMNVIESSAGSGAFVDVFKSNNVKNFEAYDIKPESEGVIKQDFLTLEKEYDPNNIVIGNPPFARNQTAEFINKSLEIGDAVAFILPWNWNGNFDFQKKVNPEAKLVLNELLGIEKFTIGRNDASVKVGLQIWVNNKSKFNSFEDLRVKEKQPTTHPDFEMQASEQVANFEKLANSVFDFAVNMRGYEADYTKRFHNRTPDGLPTRNKSGILFLKAKNQKALDILKTIDFQELALQGSLTTFGFTLRDVVAEYNRIENMMNSGVSLLKLQQEIQKRYGINPFGFEEDIDLKRVETVSDIKDKRLERTLVRDSKGKPLVVYHGSNAKFNRFELQGINRSKLNGFWFSPDKNFVMNYYASQNLIQAYVLIEQALAFEALTISEESTLDFLNTLGSNKAFESAYGDTEVNKEFARTLNTFITSDYALIYEISNVVETAEQLNIFYKTLYEKMGYDGYINYTEDGKIDTVVSFDSEKVFVLNKTIDNIDLKRKETVLTDSEKQSLISVLGSSTILDMITMKDQNGNYVVKSSEMPKNSKIPQKISVEVFDGSFQKTKTEYDGKDYAINMNFDFSNESISIPKNFGGFKNPILLKDLEKNLLAKAYYELFKKTNLSFILYEDFNTTTGGFASNSKTNVYFVNIAMLKHDPSFVYDTHVHESFHNMFYHNMNKALELIEKVSNILFTTDAQGNIVGTEVYAELDKKYLMSGGFLEYMKLYKGHKHFKDIKGLHGFLSKATTLDMKDGKTQVSVNELGAQIIGTIFSTPSVYRAIFNGKSNLQLQSYEIFDKLINNPSLNQNLKIFMNQAFSEYKELAEEHIQKFSKKFPAIKLFELKDINNFISVFTDGKFTTRKQLVDAYVKEKTQRVRGDASNVLDQIIFLASYLSKTVKTASENFQKLSDNFENFKNGVEFALRNSEAMFKFTDGKIIKNFIKIKKELKDTISQFLSKTRVGNPSANSNALKDPFKTDTDVMKFQSQWLEIEYLLQDFVDEYNMLDQEVIDIFGLPSQQEFKQAIGLLQEIELLNNEIDAEIKRINLAGDDLAIEFNKKFDTLSTSKVNSFFQSILSAFGDFNSNFNLLIDLKTAISGKGNQNAFTLIVKFLRESRNTFVEKVYNLLKTRLNNTVNEVKNLPGQVNSPVNKNITETVQKINDILSDIQLNAMNFEEMQSNIVPKLNDLLSYIYNSQKETRDSKGRVVFVPALSAEQMTEIIKNIKMVFLQFALFFKDGSLVIGDFLDTIQPNFNINDKTTWVYAPDPDLLQMFNGKKSKFSENKLAQAFGNIIRSFTLDYKSVLSKDGTENKSQYSQKTIEQLNEFERTNPDATVEFSSNRFIKDFQTPQDFMLQLIQITDGKVDFFLDFFRVYKKSNNRRAEIIADFLRNYEEFQKLNPTLISHSNKRKIAVSSDVLIKANKSKIDIIRKEAQTEEEGYKASIKFKKEELGLLNRQREMLLSEKKTQKNIMDSNPKNSPQWTKAKAEIKIIDQSLSQVRTEIQNKKQEIDILVQGKKSFNEILKEKLKQYVIDNNIQNAELSIGEAISLWWSIKREVEMQELYENGNDEILPTNHFFLGNGVHIFDNELSARKGFAVAKSSVQDFTIMVEDKKDIMNYLESFFGKEENDIIDYIKTRFAQNYENTNEEFFAKNGVNLPRQSWYIPYASNESNYDREMDLVISNRQNLAAQDSFVTKTTLGASIPLRIENIFGVLENSTVSVANYSLERIITDFQNLIVNAESGTTLQRVLGGESNPLGKGNNIIDRFITMFSDILKYSDIDESAISKFMNKIIRNSVKATVGLNIGMMAKQFASVFVIAVKLGVNPLDLMANITASMMPNNEYQQWLMENHAGFFLRAKQGNIPNLAEQIGSVFRLMRSKFNKYISYLGAHVGWADNVVLVGAFRSFVKQIEKDNPQWTKEQVYEKAVEKLDEVMLFGVASTEIAYRTHFSNDRNAMTRMFAKFQSENLLHVSAFIRAISLMKNNVKGSKRELIRALIAWLISNGISAMVTNVVQQMRGNISSEDALETLIIKNFLLDNMLGSIPVLSALTSAIDLSKNAEGKWVLGRGFTTELPFIGEFVRIGGHFASMFNGKDVERKALKMLDEIGMIFGVPIKNTNRIIQTMSRLLASQGNETGIEIYNFYKSYSRAQGFSEAISQGNETLMNRYIEEQFDDIEIQNEIIRLMKAMPKEKINLRLDQNFEKIKADGSRVQHKIPDQLYDRNVANTKKALRLLMKTTGYKRAADKEKIRVIQRIINYYYNFSKSVVLKEKSIIEMMSMDQVVSRAADSTLTQIELDRKNA